MRILFLAHNSDLYGASRSLLRISTRLCREGHSVAVLSPEPGPLLEALNAVGARAEVFTDMAVVDRAKVKRFGGLIALGWAWGWGGCQLASWVRKWKPDLIHTNSAVILAAVPLARMLKIPHVWHIREIFSEFPLFWKIFRILIGAGSDRIICISEAVRQQFQGSRAHGKTVVLYNGIPQEEFILPEGNRGADFRERFQLGQAFVFANVGRIKLARKGQETFVEAAGLIAGEFPDCRFVIVGAPFAGNEDHLKILQDRVRQLALEQQVVFTGEVNDLAEVFHAIDVEVLTSAHPEPLGNVVIEAMACRKPVIATNIGGPPEMIEEGISGLLVPPADPEALAQAMRVLIGDPDRCRSMGEAGNQRFLEKFEFQVFYGHLLEQYQKLTGSE